jgi:hypothetical protein
MQVGNLSMRMEKHILGFIQRWCKHGGLSSFDDFGVKTSNRRFGYASSQHISPAVNTASEN